MLSLTAPTILDNLNLDHRMREILQAEPRLQPILDQAVSQETGPRYDRIRTYFHLRNQIIPFVGCMLITLIFVILPITSLSWKRLSTCYPLIV